MHAEFVIKPNGQRIFELLPSIFGDHDPQALMRSRVLSGLTNPSNPRYYACEERPTYRLCAWWSTSGTSRLFVEPIQALDVRQTCQEIWDELRTSAKDLGARLDSVTLEDQTAKSRLADARTGVLPSGRRVEIMWAFAAALASVAWLILAYFVFELSGDLVLGTVPAIVTGVAAAAYAALDSRSGTLYWR